MGTSPSQSWQSVLQRMIKAPGERQRLANALGLSSMTLNRWANGDSNPQKPHLMRLVQIVEPQYRDDLLSALEENYPDIQSWQKNDVPEFISSEFFAEILDVRTTTTETLRFWRISDMILKQALIQLDPNQLGMSVTIVQCMPPSPRQDNKICSLRERVGKGIFPWTIDLEHLSLFLGMESLAGYAVETCHVVSIEDLRKDKIVPAYRMDYEISAAAHPIMLGGRVAGCLAASSTQPDHFNQQRLALLEAFSDLTSLTFDREDFYPPELIELRALPRPARQRPLISSFRQRVSKVLINPGPSRKRMSNREAEYKVWQDIEEELLNLPEEADSEEQEQDAADL